MGWFSKKPDPISQRARTLGTEIAALEAQIKELSASIKAPPKPAPPTVAPKTTEAPLRRNQPIFESLEGRQPLGMKGAPETPAHFNERGVRKYDLVAVWKRILAFFDGPDVHNPRLVNYLAAGSIHGLQPLRYEKRVARRRFLALFAGFLLAMLGLLAIFLKNR